MKHDLKTQIRSEIAFLTGRNMKWLVKEADIGTCHQDFKPIERRVKKLRNLLERLK
jgi:hypothetical protein